MWSLLSVRRRPAIQSRQRARTLKKTRCQLRLESLEDRTLPTAIFNPIFGAEAPKGDGGQRLNSEPVFLILWGSYWGDRYSQQAVTVEQAALGMLGSPYLTGINQYGSDGLTTFVGASATAVWPFTEPSNGSFAEGDINDVVNQVLDADGLPALNLAIYVVVTPPGIVSSHPNAGGFNFVGDHPAIWLSTTTTDNNPNSPNIYADGVSWTLSHEMAEIMTDPGTNGFEVNPGANWTGGGSGNQIGDYEGNTYSYREPNGVLVQPLWSANDNAWIAPDGNQQNLLFNPFWNAAGFTGKYDLTIQGGQGGSTSDFISIDSKGGGILVRFDGEQTQFDPGFIRNVTINTGGGSTQINVESTLAGSPVTINLGTGTDYVNITPTSQNLSSLQAAIQVTGGPGSHNLFINDQADGDTSAYAIGASEVTKGFDPPISFTGMSTITLNGGLGDPAYYVFDTQEFATTRINCAVRGGSANDTINVLGTTGYLNISTGTPNDVINLGTIYSLQNIARAVKITNNDTLFGWTGATIHVDDAGDPLACIGVLDTIVPPGETLPFGIITGFHAGAIEVQWQGTQALDIMTGKYSDSFYVHSTGCPVSLDSAGGTDTVTVGGDRGGLGNLPSDVQQILGALTVSNSHGLTKLIVDDSGDYHARGVTITSSLLHGLAPADIAYQGSELESLTVYGGSGGNTFWVRSTPGGGPSGGMGASVALFAGAGSDTILVGDTNDTLDGIQGPLAVSGEAGPDTLNIFDNGSPTAHTYTLTSTATTSTILRSGAAPITYDNTTEDVTVKGSNAVDTYTVQSPVPAFPVSFVGAGTMNTLVGPDVANTLWRILLPDLGQLGLVAFSGMQNLVGGGSSNTFRFLSAGSISGTIDGGSSQLNTLDYSVQSFPVSVELAVHQASHIHGGAANGFSRINSLIGSSSAASNDLGGPTGNVSWQITNFNEGSVGTVLFSGFGTLLGNTGVDSFRFGPSGSLSGKIDGGGGGDWLDYSPRTTAVTVNLALGTASSVVGGVSRIQNVIGSAGNDTLTGNALGNILIGGAGINVIKGGNGRSLLIGGKGSSTITGGASDDILIAGTTSYDANEIALMAILTEWQRTDLSYTQRVAALSTGANKLVWGVTVFDDDAPGSHLIAGGGMDWIFKGPNDP